MNPEMISLISRAIVGLILGEILLMLYVYTNKRYWNTLCVEDKLNYKLFMLIMGFVSTYTSEVFKTLAKLAVTLYEDIGFAITWLINNVGLIFETILTGIGLMLLSVVGVCVIIMFLSLNLRLCNAISGKSKRRKKSRRKKRI